MLQARLVEPSYHLVTDRDDGHRHLAGEPDQILPGVDVLHHIDVFERHAFGAKELLRLSARHSRGARVHDNAAVRHGSSSGFLDPAGAGGVSTLAQRSRGRAPGRPGPVDRRQGGPAPRLKGD